jgi:hypothetical protein
VKAILITYFILVHTHIDALARLRDGITLGASALRGPGGIRSLGLTACFVTSTQGKPYHGWQEKM